MQAERSARPDPIADVVLAARALAKCTAGQARELISRLLDTAGLDYDERFEVLAGALVSEAVRPYWEAGHDAAVAHDLLRRNDQELADVLEAIAPVLLGRAEARDEARIAIERVESLLLRSSNR